MVSQIANRKSQNYNSNGKSTNIKTRAYNFSLDIIKFVNELPNQKAFWSIGDQLLRAATSIGANIVEAKSSSSKREFLNFFQIALKSANEAKYWLAVLRELLPEKKLQINSFISELDEIAKIIGTSVLTMKGKTKI